MFKFWIEGFSIKCQKFKVVWSNSLILIFSFVKSFWCNRSDSCDNDNVFANHACQPKKSVYEYCEDSHECLDQLGLVCYPERQQCDCPDLENNYWSNASLRCLPKRSFHGWCTENLECLVNQGLECDLPNGKCDCVNQQEK